VCNAVYCVSRHAVLCVPTVSPGDTVDYIVVCYIVAKRCMHIWVCAVLIWMLFVLCCVHTFLFLSASPGDTVDYIVTGAWSKKAYEEAGGCLQKGPVRDSSRNSS
jgi:hypothetical protein